MHCSDASDHALRLACVEEYVFLSVFCCWRWVAFAEAKDEKNVGRGQILEMLIAEL